MLNIISLIYTIEELKLGIYNYRIVILSSLAVKPTVQYSIKAVALNESLPLILAYGLAIS